MAKQDTLQPAASQAPSLFPVQSSNWFKVRMAAFSARFCTRPSKQVLNRRDSEHWMFGYLTHNHLLDGPTHCFVRSRELHKTFCVEKVQKKPRIEDKEWRCEV